MNFAVSDVVVVVGGSVVVVVDAVFDFDFDVLVILYQRVFDMYHQ